MSLPSTPIWNNWNTQSQPLMSRMECETACLLRRKMVYTTFSDEYDVVSVFMLICMLQNIWCWRGKVSLGSTWMSKKGRGRCNTQFFGARLGIIDCSDVGQSLRKGVFIWASEKDGWRLAWTRRWNCSQDKLQRRWRNFASSGRSCIAATLQMQFPSAIKALKASWVILSWCVLTSARWWVKGICEYRLEWCEGKVMPGNWKK